MSKVYCSECKFYYEDWELFSGPSESVSLCRQTKPDSFEKEESYLDRPETITYQAKLKPFIHNKNNDCDLWEELNPND